ncbi:TetR/AcrR family transcriptional regulator C-terminal domain-containing protein [Actinocorallia longicatena]|uniref:TetR/AcrR family transcriptional regulator C-terminal domain-containing protein n=1 Tax=Actinocorallia longicatena TaxID=111803 RepID=A0ABP6QDZ2_9ACTN
MWTRNPPSRRPALTREAIVAAAIEIGDTEGLAAISIRRIAAHLGARAMSLYTHIDRKEDLLDLMADEVISEILVADAELPADWREAITRITRLERQVLLRHPWLTEMIGFQRFSPGPNRLHHLEQCLKALDGLGLDGPSAIRVVGAVTHYMLGCVIREASDADLHRDRCGGHDEKLPYLLALTEGPEFPRLGPLLRAGSFVKPSPEQRFEQGLEWLLDGIEASVGKPGGLGGPAHRGRTTLDSSQTGTGDS